VIALPGFLVLLVFPVAGKLLGAGRLVATVALVTGLAFLVVGLGMWFTAGGQRRRHAVAATEAALRTLERGEDDRDVLLRAATLLLVRAHVAERGAVVSVVDVARARARLGARLPLVEGVEERLLAEEAIHPVLSDEARPDLD
jgi:hypothetical protein